MHYILNIETATKNCSVSLAADGKTLVCKEISELGFSHAEKLHLFIEDVIQEAGISWSQLSAIAVSQGPGSYTGLRIGVSAAKGLSYALQIPLISVDTLASLAHQVTQNDGLIVPMIDARRMEVYSAIFDSNKQKIRAIQAEIITEESFASISEIVYFVGDSNEKVKTVLTKSNFVFLDAIQYPSAKEMSAISYQKFEEKNFEDVAYFEPFYLKDFLFAK
jgi:tRNA threonylcarbamoyladenosine biosynthesis protein TsaB